MNILDKQINDFSKYFISMEKMRDLNIIKVSFPDKWKCFGSDNGIIKAELSTHDIYLPNNQVNQIPVFWVYGKQSEVGFDDLTEHIKGVVKYNIELSEKRKLFQEKGDELKKLFAENDLKTLKTLVFKYRKPKAKINKIDDNIKLEKDGKIND